MVTEPATTGGVRMMGGGGQPHGVYGSHGMQGMRQMPGMQQMRQPGGQGFGPAGYAGGGAWGAFY